MLPRASACCWLARSDIDAGGPVPLKNIARHAGIEHHVQAVQPGVPVMTFVECTNRGSPHTGAGSDRSRSCRGQEVRQLHASMTSPRIYHDVSVAMTHLPLLIIG